jgi:hypothetical protein
LTVNAKVILQGAYAYPASPGDPLMNTYLRDADVIPYSQPYATTPWEYYGTESAVTLPANMVDWVLVELRTDVNNLDSVASRAGILLSDGSIVDLDGGLLKFPGLDMDNYYVVIQHRNHLSIMSSVAVPLQSNSVLYDFTSSDSQSYYDSGIVLAQLADLGDGSWGLYNGDVTSDGEISLADVYTIFPQIDVLYGGYYLEDVNLDTEVSLSDYYFTLLYLDIPSHVPNY